MDNNAVLLNKLINCNDTSIELYRHYLKTKLNSSFDVSGTFNSYIDSIKYLSDKPFDFQWVITNAKQFDCTRRDFIKLCDDICMILGKCVEELCCHAREPIITKPTKMDNCPFSSAELVLYGNKVDSVKYDGYIYKVADTKLEATPYYTIYANLLER